MWWLPGVAVLVDCQMGPDAPKGAQENGKSAGAGGGNPGRRPDVFSPGGSQEIHENAAM